MKASLMIVMSMMFAVGCNDSDKPHVDIDYNGYSYYVWQNDSSYPIALNITDASNQRLSISIAPGKRDDSVVRETMADASFQFVSAQKMEVVFDGEALSAEYIPLWWAYPDMRPVGYNPERDPTWWENYQREVVDSPEGCKQCPGMRYTYTFTEADYQAAKAMVEAAAE